MTAESKRVLRWHIHKVRGTCRFVHVEAERLEFSGAAALFYSGDRLVMSYAPWAWKAILEEGPILSAPET